MFIPISEVDIVSNMLFFNSEYIFFGIIRDIRSVFPGQEDLNLSLLYVHHEIHQK